MKRSRLATDSVLILAFAVILIWPLFHLEYLDNWSSIDSTFIGDARMLGDNLPHPGWQPLWYTGTRFDYIYPPALRYGTALISRYGGVSTSRAYHLYTAFFYVSGLLAVYWLMIAGAGSRLAAWIATLGTAIISPSFVFLSSLRHNSGFGAPQRLHVLLQYGEGPHISALCVLPAALAAMWIGIRTRRTGMLALAAILSALVVSNNFYGATALALFTPVMAWCAWTGVRDWRVWGRTLAVAALAYGLCAFWLTPGYVGITLANLRLVAEPGNRTSALLFFGSVGLFGVASFLAGNRKPERSWTLFTVGAAWVLAVYVLGHDYFGIQVFGNTVRLAPEMDLAFLTAFATGVAMLWPHRKGRAAAAILLALALVPGIKYLKQPWAQFRETTSPTKSYPWEIAQRAWSSVPEERVLASGEVRFWFNAWFDTPQLDGGSQQGMLNQLLPVALWQILTGDQQEPAVLWLQALGTDVVIVPDKRSRDEYRGDFVHPEKFHGLPVLFDDAHGTVAYRVPRARSGIGRIVDAKAISSIGAVTGGLDVARLKAYTAETEKAGRPPVSVNWQGFDDVRVHAMAAPGEAILLQETWDPAWTAEEHGQPLAIQRDQTMGFMMIPVTPGQHDIHLRFTTPGENRVGQVLSATCLLSVVLWFFVKRRVTSPA